MTGSQPLLHLPSGPTSLVARLHPVVLFNICDSYIRRNENQERVIGTLLGTIGADGTVEIKNSYAVPHSESSEQVALDIEYHHTMLELTQKVNSSEVLVGWYSTGGGVSASDALIQDFYARETPNPIHVTVDTTFSSQRASMKAYVASHLALGDRQLASHFQEIQLDVSLVEAERIGMENLTSTMVEKIPSDTDNLEATIHRVQEMVEKAHSYVDDVVEGRVKGDLTVGRFLADTVALVPALSGQDYDKLFNHGVQDLLLVTYLANITRTQLALAEKLNTTAQPI